MSDRLKQPDFFFNLEELGNFDLLVDGIFTILVDQLGFSQPALAIYDENNKALKFVKNNSHPIVHSMLKKFLNKSIADFSFPLINLDNIAVRSFLDKKIIISTSIEPLARPTLSKQFAKMIDRAISLKSVIIIPILDENQSVGVIAMGSKVFKNYTESEKKILLDFSSSIGKYINDSWRLFEENQLRPIQKYSVLLDLDKNFLESAGRLLQDLAILQKLSSEDQEDLKNHIEYLKSLVLIHDNFKK